jgi:hypothetical protein
MATEFRGGWPSTLRRRFVLLTGVPALLATLAGTLGPYITETQGLPTLIVVGGGWLFLSWLVGGPYTYRVTDAGLVREGRFRDTLAEWGVFEAVETTDDRLLVRRPGRWPPSVEARFPDEEDRDAVVDALGRHLPRE